VLIAVLDDDLIGSCYLGLVGRRRKLLLLLQLTSVEFNSWLNTVVHAGLVITGPSFPKAGDSLWIVSDVCCLSVCLPSSVPIGREGQSTRAAYWHEGCRFKRSVIYVL